MTADAHGSNGRLAALSLAALGIVFGDIGTSPLYALRESFHGNDLATNSDNVLGVLSLIFWSLIIVISIKYLVFVLRADNDGEGGILALTALLGRAEGIRRTRWVLILLGLFGTALLYGDGMITPAISVLSAVEGTEEITPALDRWVVPIAVAILVALFAIQRRGTASIGKLFGPVMVVWFVTLAVLGVSHIVQAPSVVGAINPGHAVAFFSDNGFEAFLVLGSVFLVVTGGEALYADMGHFGVRPIRLGWFAFVLPALLLNYFGQGALLLDHPEEAEQPFYGMAPEWALIPLVVLATMATVIASQALISGVFSLTRQAVQLGYAPRTRIVHTSPSEVGQIYLPAVNWALMVSCITLVITFGSSTNLAAAYGVAVTSTMVITTLIFYVVARERFGWTRPFGVVVCAAFLVVDSAFLGANLFKIPDGGWFPLVVGGVVFTLMTTWRTGRRLVAQRITEDDVPLATFLDGAMADGSAPSRVPGTAVYLFSVPGYTPPALALNLRYNRVLHERVLVVSVLTTRSPHVPAGDRADVADMGAGVYRVVLHYGFMEEPLVPDGLTGAALTPPAFDADTAVYLLGAESLVVTHRPGMARWRERLFAVMNRNASNAASYFCLPRDRTMTVGLQVEL